MNQRKQKMNQQNKNYVNKLKELIHNAQKIALIGHKDPDGDCLGSLLGIFGLIQQMKGKIEDDHYQMHVYVDGETPDNFQFLPDISKIDNKVSDNIYDLTLVLDASDKNRLGTMKSVFEKSNITAVIDHHITHKPFCDMTILEPTYSSTGEMIFQLAKVWGLNITQNIGICLYTAMLTDTGRFIYSSTSVNTLLAAAELMGLGVPFDKIAQEVYGSDKKEVYLAKSYLQSQTIFALDGLLAIIVMSRDVLDKFGVYQKDVDGLAESLRDIAGVEIGCLIKDLGSNNAKVSLRSKGTYDVAKFSASNGGGGHARAAGFNLEMTAEHCIPWMIEALQTYIEGAK